jgi:hypothetical protein
VKKEIILSHKEFISGLLLTSVFIGSLAALLAISWPYLGLVTLKFIDGAPDTPSLMDNFIKLLASLLPAAPIALLLGSVSAFLYTFVEPENKVFLRIWGAILLLVFVAFTYQYIR